MGLIEKILATSTIVAATGAIVHGMYEIVTSSEKLYNLPKSYKKKNTKVSNMTKAGVCRICDSQGYTEWHHIISRGHAIKTNQDELVGAVRRDRKWLQKSTEIMIFWVDITEPFLKIPLLLSMVRLTNGSSLW